MSVFEFSDTGLTVHEVLGGNRDDSRDMLTVHQELFPQFSSYLPYMHDRAQHPPEADSRCVEHWWLARIHGEAAAVQYFKYIPQRHCGLTLGIAIRPAFRPLTFGDYGRFSRMLIYKSLEQVRDDAVNLARPIPIGIVVEAEPYMLKRYDEYNFIRLAIDYLEPSSTPEASAAQGADSTPSDVTFRPIQLGLLLLEDTQFDPDSLEMLQNIALAFLVDHYGLFHDHWAVQRALESIPTTYLAGDTSDARH